MPPFSDWQTQMQTLAGPVASFGDCGVMNYGIHNVNTTRHISPAAFQQMGDVYGAYPQTAAHGPRMVYGYGAIGPAQVDTSFNAINAPNMGYMGLPQGRSMSFSSPFTVGGRSSCGVQQYMVQHPMIQYVEKHLFGGKMPQKKVNLAANPRRISAPYCKDKSSSRDSGSRYKNSKLGSILEDDRAMIDMEYFRLLHSRIEALDELVAMSKPNVEVDQDFLVSLGGLYKEFKVATKEITIKLETHQKELEELYSQMGRNIPTKQTEPHKSSDASLWNSALKEMDDFQGLVVGEHREKRRKYKQVVASAIKHTSKIQSRRATLEQEELRNKRLSCKNVCNMVAVYWKKIEKFAWERMKRDLQATLLEKKRLRLDKFVEDAIKLSINQNERIRTKRRIKTEGSDVKKETTDTHKRGKTNDGAAVNVKNDDVPADDQDEFIVSEEMKQMERDDAELEVAMERENEAQDYKQEIGALEDDLNMPIEEILKRYQEDAAKYAAEYQETSTPGDVGSPITDSDECLDSTESDSQDPNDATSGGNFNVDTKEPQSLELDDEQEFDIGEDMYKKQEMEDEALDQDMSSDSDDDTKQQQEIHALQNDAEMPIEQLLEMYKKMENDHMDIQELPSPSSTHEVAGSNSDPQELSAVSSDDSENSPRDSVASDDPDEVQVPCLIRAVLRPYQLDGLRWLASLYRNKSNGILADEMGLGKTLQTIALLAHLACDHGNWGPHLIVVPTSVLLNWEMEFKKFCPGFTILSYYGTPAERAKKRVGWNKEYAFNVCIVSYATVVQDAHILKRKSWVYMVLDEAQNIKNFHSKRWQTLLTFNTQGRLLLTGTPLQNSLQELWSLMHFILPDIFTSHSEFKEWFSDPLTESIEKEQTGATGAIVDSQTAQLVKKLHTVLRPYLLRRLKKDVEKQMPSKYEHVIKCYLSRRQRILYDEFITSRSTVDAMSNPSYRSMLFVLMQLRKICNHPDQLQPRPVESPYYDPGMMQDVVIPSMMLLEDRKHDQRLYKYEIISFYRNPPNSLPVSIGLTGKIERVATPVSFVRSYQGLKVPFNRLYSENDNGYHKKLVHLPVVDRLPISKCLSSKRSGGRRKLRLCNQLINRMLKVRSYDPVNYLSNWRRYVSSGMEPVKSRVITDTGSINHPADPMKLGDGAPGQTATENAINGGSNIGVLGGLREDTPDRMSMTRPITTIGYSGDRDVQVLDIADLGGTTKLNEYIKQAKSKNKDTLVNRRELLEVNEQGILNLFKVDKRPKPKVELFADLVQPSADDIAEKYWWIMSRFVCTTGRPVQCVPRKVLISGTNGVALNQSRELRARKAQKKLSRPFIRSNFMDKTVTMEMTPGLQRILFPPRNLLHDDCGKFLVLGNLLNKLKNEGHRCLLYTQFSKMLDILENWINLMGFTYIRLDGSTKVDMRQRIVTRFNENQKIFLFISSTRAGGVGLTLTGADTVIFYDTDWNPAMDRQAMDRCHRIGQTREVNVYRLISEHTVEENIWRKQLQKRRLDDIVVDKGNFDTETHTWFSNVDTLLNILKEQGSSSSSNNDDIYGRKVLHESEAPVVEAATTEKTKSRVVNMLAEAEDEDDANALKSHHNELGSGTKDFQDFQSDIISSMPALVAYSIKLLLRFNTPTLIAQRDEMQVKIKVASIDSDYVSSDSGDSSYSGTDSDSSDPEVEE
uniref:Snf2-related chromatin remodeling factor SRCAP n=2 Tax=Babesia bovis TaxID=5865 RepID=A7ASL0_BABBO|eukprot:XP_001611097.1 snf2-related chromatin remodeling factor SRCAP [Babesia bovis T2Bo]